MEYRGLDQSAPDWAGDALAVGFFEGAVELTGSLAQLDDKLDGTLQELISETEFEGKSGSSAVTRVGGGSPIRKIIAVGLGKEEKVKLDDWRQAVAAATIRRGSRMNCR